jgi:hypothetical protein
MTRTFARGLGVVKKNTIRLESRLKQAFSSPRPGGAGGVFSFPPEWLLCGLSGLLIHHLLSNLPLSLEFSDYLGPCRNLSGVLRARLLAFLVGQMPQFQHAGLSQTMPCTCEHPHSDLRREKSCVGRFNPMDWESLKKKHAFYKSHLILNSFLFTLTSGVNIFVTWVFSIVAMEAP